jgi:hypothetical protein
MVHSSTGERGTEGDLFRLLVGKQNLLSVSLLLQSSCLPPSSFFAQTVAFFSFVFKRKKKRRIYIKN